MHIRFLILLILTPFILDGAELGDFNVGGTAANKVLSATVILPGDGGLLVEVGISGANSSSDYRLGFRLSNSAGSAVDLDLRDGGGALLATEMSGEVIYTSAITPTLGTIIGSFRLTPPVDLALDDYEVTVLLEYNNGKNWVSESLDNLNPTSSAFELRVFPEGSDSQRNVKLRVEKMTLDREVIFSGFSGLDAYPCTLDVRALRYDEDSSFSTSVTALVSAVFVEADGVTEVPAEISIDNVSFSSETSVGLSGINPLSGAGVPSTQTFSESVYVRPSGPLTVGSELTTVRVSIRHNDYVGFGIVMAAAPVADVTERLFASDGTFMSGSVAFDFNAIGGASVVSVSGDTATVQVSGTAFSVATGHSYGGGAVLTFTSDQVPKLSSTLVLAAPSSPDEVAVNGVLMRRGTVALTSTGPQMYNGEIRLPRGLGYTIMDAEYGYGSNLAKGWMKIVGDSTGVVSLNGDLEPSQSTLALHPLSSSSAAGAVEIALNEESKPFVWVTDAVTWAPPSGVVTWSALKVRSIHDDEWDILEETAASIPSGYGVSTFGWLQKRDNRAYLREPDIPAATAEVPNPENVIVGTATAGDARLFAQLILGIPNGGSAYSLYPQFPAGSLVNWTNTGVGGQLTMSNDMVFGELLGVVSIIQLYNPSGIDGDCFGATSKTLLTELPAGDQTMAITPDGGLLSPALLFNAASATSLQIGVTEDAGGNPVAVHTVEGWTNDSMDYLMAGVSLPGASGWHTGNTSSDLGVSTLLNTGFGRNENGTLFTERPGTTAYAAGDASYAGLNFRVASASGAVTGFTYLGDSRIPESGSYGLRNNSKYYVRLGGVSGAHDVDFTSHGGVYPVYGYELDFYQFGLSYLNNLNAEYGLDSTVAADLGFSGAPLNGFALAFDSMSVTGNGDLKSGDLIVDGADPKEPLSYWGGSAIPGSFAFNPSLADLCAKERLLVLGVETYAALIDSPLHGYLAIASATTPGSYSNGSLVSLKDGEAFGVRPRVFLPSLVQMRGPAQIVGGETTYEVYPIRPVADAYFNNYDTPSRPASGFMAFGATMGVSFFEDLKIHVRMPAANGPDSGLADTTAVYLSGGWNTGGNTFWNHPEGDDFDKEHKGWDGDFTDYWTKNHENAAYDIRAEQDLFGLIEISYPVQWNPTLRQFTGNKQAVDLVVLNANHKLDFLTAERASITFGVKAELEGIPNINLGTLAMNATGAADGLLATLSQTASAEVGLILDKGSGALNQLLADVPEELFSQTWEAVIAPRLSGLDFSSIPNFTLIDDIALQLDNAVEYTTDVEDALKGYFLPDGETWFFNVATEAMQAIDEGGSVIRKIDSSLAEVQNGIRAVSSFSVGNLSAESLWEGTVETLQSDGTILILNWEDLKEKAITDFE